MLLFLICCPSWNCWRVSYCNTNISSNIKYFYNICQPNKPRCWFASSSLFGSNNNLLEDFLLILLSSYCRVSTNLYHLFVWCNCCKYSLLQYCQKCWKICWISWSVEANHFDLSQIVFWYCSRLLIRNGLKNLDRRNWITKE